MTLTLNRRSFLRGTAATLAGASLSSVSLANTAEKLAPASELTAANSPFQLPTAENPIQVHYNENPLGMSPKAQKAAIEVIARSNRYGDHEAEKLRGLIAAYHKVKDENILLSAGSSDAIRIAIAAHATAETQFVIPELTYGDGQFFAEANGLKITKVKTDPTSWATDLTAMQSAVENHAGPSIVYLVNPNNPTSTVVNSGEVESWINSKPKDTLFILDEAYAEFVNNPDYRSVDHLIAGGADNVILLKTFSKIHAMAGMRVGYTVAVADKIKKLSDYLEFDGLSLAYPSIMAATESMQDAEFLAYSKKSNDVAKGIYLAALQELGWFALPSETNFVFHRIPGTTEAFKQYMQEQHIIVGRPFAEGWCRVSMGTPEETLYIVEKLKEYHKRNG